MEDIFKEQETDGMLVHLGSINKTSLEVLADEITLSVDEGEKSGLEVLIQAKGLEELSKMIQSKVKDVAMSEAEDYGSGESRIRGVGFTIKNLPNKLDFSGDEVWCSISNKIEELKAQLKSREEDMKNAMKYGGLSTDGGYIPAAKVKEFGGQTIQITIPKK